MPVPETNIYAVEYTGDHVALDLVWGVSAIAKAIGRTERQTYHLLLGGAVSPAKKVGGRWVVSRKALAGFFSGAA